MIILQEKCQDSKKLKQIYVNYVMYINQGKNFDRYSYPSIAIKRCYELINQSVFVRMQSDFNKINHNLSIGILILLLQFQGLISLKVEQIEESQYLFNFIETFLSIFQENKKKDKNSQNYP
ncbi:unnamed protein product [Paramecium sonneborni]|uniref:Uncharacterized protein n=1 Tax=Paramecium sonneborni TaxID=65129 RepID=A0A8S1QXW9_9CILI|nr:unnamed protein product [Paramecium sonneborni]